jgi:hypothetical protein
LARVSRLSVRFIAGPIIGSAARRSQVLCRCRPLIAAVAAAFALALGIGMAQTPASGTLAQSATPDPNAQFLQPTFAGNPTNPPRFRRSNAFDNQAPATGTFTAPSRVGAIPTYGSPRAFGAGGTGFDSANLSKNQKKKLQGQVVKPGPGLDVPETTFDPVPTTQFDVPSTVPVRPVTPPPAIYPSKAASRPGASLPQVAQPLPVSNPLPEVYPLPAANRPGAKLPVPQAVDAEETARAALNDPNTTASTPPPNTPALNSLPLGTVPQPGLPIGDNDPYSPIGIRGGSFIFFPSVELSAGADSNPQHLPGGASSPYFVVAPEVLVQSEWARHSLTADIKGSYTDYTNGSFEPSLSRPYFNSIIDGRIDVTRDTQLLLENRVLVTTSNPGNPNLQADLAKLPIGTTVGGTFGILQNFNRFFVSVKGLFDRSTYQPSQLVDGESVSNQDENFNQYAGVARVGYEIDPGLKPFVEVQQDQRVHDDKLDFNGQLRDSIGTSVKAGATLDLFTSLTGEIALGYIHRTYQDPNLPDIGGATLDGTLTWKMTGLTTARLTASSLVNESILQNVSGTLSRDISIEVDHALRRWFVINGIVGYGRDEYVGLSRTDNRYFVSGGATYKLTRELSLKGELRQDWLTSNIADTSYTATSVLFTLRLQR